jgi:hypothetical protein
MALVHNTGKKRRNTEGILSIFGEIMRQIGGVCNGKAFNQRFSRVAIISDIALNVCCFGNIYLNFP